MNKDLPVLKELLAKAKDARPVAWTYDEWDTEWYHVVSLCDPGLLCDPVYIRNIHALYASPPPAASVPTGEEDAARTAKYRRALEWALGVGGEIHPREKGEGSWWWRKQLTKMLGWEWRDGKYHEAARTPTSGELESKKGY